MLGLSLLSLSVLYISPGVTSYQGFNLGYRIYTIDGDYSDSTHSVLDHETYVFDLDKANYDNNPEWALEYSAKVSNRLMHGSTVLPKWLGLDLTVRKGLKC